MLYRINGETGKTVWKATLPSPTWPDYSGSDHLILTPAGVAVAIPGVMYYNQPINATVTGVSMDTGAISWSVNISTTTVDSARLSRDGTSLFVKWRNHSLNILDVRTGRILKTFDLSSRLVAGIVYGFTLAEGVTGKAGQDDAPGQEETTANEQRLRALKPSASPPPPPAGGQTFLVFSTVGNVTSFNGKSGKWAWTVDDPTHSPFAVYPSVGHVAGTNRLLIATGGNYLDPQGAAALDASKGSLLWNISWYGTTIGAVRYPTTQGWEWVRTDDSSGYSSVQLLDSSNGTRLGQGYLPRGPGSSSLSFTSPVAVSGDGRMGYQTGEASACDTCGDDVYLMGWGMIGPSPDVGGAGASGSGTGLTGPGLDATSMDATAFTVNGTVYNVMINELCHPDYRYVALGPKPGQLTVWHTNGVVVYQPGPPGPQPYTRKYSELCR